MKVALLSCPTAAGTVADRLNALGWRSIAAPPEAGWETLLDTEAELLIAELPGTDWRACLRSARTLMRRRPGLRTVFLSPVYPEGYTSEVLDGQGCIPLVRLPFPPGALEQSLAAAG